MTQCLAQTLLPAPGHPPEEGPVAVTGTGPQDSGGCSALTAQDSGLMLMTAMSPVLVAGALQSLQSA